MYKRQGQERARLVDDHSELLLVQRLQRQLLRDIVVGLRSLDHVEEQSVRESGNVLVRQRVDCRCVESDRREGGICRREDRELLLPAEGVDEPGFLRRGEERREFTRLSIEDDDKLDNVLLGFLAKRTATLKTEQAHTEDHHEFSNQS